MGILPLAVVVADRLRSQLLRTNGDQCYCALLSRDPVGSGEERLSQLELMHNICGGMPQFDHQRDLTATKPLRIKITKQNSHCAADL